MIGDEKVDLHVTRLVPVRLLVAGVLELSAMLLLNHGPGGTTLLDEVDKHSGVAVVPGLSLLDGGGCLLMAGVLHDNGLFLRNSREGGVRGRGRC